MSSFFQKVRDRFAPRNDAQPSTSITNETSGPEEATNVEQNAEEAGISAEIALPVEELPPIEDEDARPAVAEEDADELLEERPIVEEDDGARKEEEGDRLEAAEEIEPKPDEKEEDSASTVPDEPQPSQFRDDLFIQMRQNFQRTTREAFAISQLMSEIPPISSAEMQHFRSLSTAISISVVFHNVALVLQGFLSGLAVFHATISFVFTDVTALIKGYQYMAAPMHAVFYFCFVITAIDAMDRFETGGTWRSTLDRCLKLQRGGLGLFIAIFGTTCSVIMTKFEEYLTVQLDVITEPESTSIIAWRWLSAVRAVCAVCGWLLFALSPTANYTRDQLIAMAPAMDSAVHVHGLETDLSSGTGRMMNEAFSTSLGNSGGGLNLSQELIASMKALAAAQKTLPP